MADVTISQVGSEITEPTGDELFEVEVPGSPAEGAHMSLDTIAAYAGGGGGGGAALFAGTPKADGGYEANRYSYLPPVTVWGSAGATTLANGSLYWAPHSWDQDIRIIASGVRTTGAGSSIRAVIATADQFWQPAAVIDQWVFDVSAGAGTYETTGMTLDLPAGRYVVGLRPEGSNVSTVHHPVVNPLWGEFDISNGALHSYKCGVITGTGTGTITDPAPKWTGTFSTHYAALACRWELAP